MYIRNLRPDDYPEADRLMGLLHKLHVDARPDLYVPMEHIYSEEKFGQMLDSQDYITLGAELDGKLIGLCIAEIRRRSFMVEQCSVYVDDLIVDPDFRRRGIASALMAQCRRHALACGAKRIDLMVWDFNEDALAFYKAQGMKMQRCILEKIL